jgi:hypothetical protein
MAVQQTPVRVDRALCKSSACFCHRGYLEGEPAVQERSMDEGERWNAYYASRVNISEDRPHPFLRQHLALLPRGRILELAMGEGHNAIFWHDRGFLSLALISLLSR